MEWSDTEQIVSASRARSAESKIVYPGVLEYYIDNGGSTLLTEQGQTVLRKDLANTFEERRSPEHINEEVKTALKESLSDGKRRIGAINTQGGYMDDPCAYAKNVYGGTFWGVNWKNTWESYAHFAIMTDFAKNEPNCCPAAITNLIKMYGEKYNKTTIRNATDKSVYSKVMAANDGYYNPTGVIEETAGGTGFFWAGRFIKDSFKQYGINTVDTFDAGQLNYQKTITLFDSPNKLMLISIPYSETKHPYGSHAVIGYAYNRVCNSAGIYRAFIKISDGRNVNRKGRYVEIDSVAFGGKFWEITF